MELKKQMAARGMIPASEAADLAGVYIQTIYRWAAAGKIAGWKEGTRWYVDLASLQKFQPHLSGDAERNPASESQ